MTRWGFPRARLRRIPSAAVGAESSKDGPVDGAVGHGALRRAVPFIPRTRFPWGSRRRRGADPALRGLRSSRRVGSSLSVRTIALVVGSLGLLDLHSAVTPPLGSRLEALTRAAPLVLRQGAHLVSAVSGFALMVLAVSLWKRRRVARWITLGVLAASTAAHLVKGLDYEEATLSFLVGLWLWSLRDEFVGRSDPASLRRALRLSVAASAFTLAYGTLGFWLLDQHFSVALDLRAAVEQTLRMFTPAPVPELRPTTPFGRDFAESIYLVAGANLIFGLMLTLRPVLAREPADRSERERAREIILEHGRDSSALMGLLPDKRYCFTEGGSVVAYVVRNTVGLALAEPVGPATDTDEAIATFQELCASQGWIPAWYQTSAAQHARFREFGYQAICLGHQALVDLEGFTLEGGRWKDMRGKVRRVEREGCRARVHQPPHPAALLDELASVSDEWLARAKGREKRFTLGWFDRDYLQQGPLMVVHDADERPLAFANIIALERRGEASVDLMRHREDIPKNTMLFLFANLLRWARDAGYQRFDMGMAPLYGVGNAASDPAIHRALHLVYERGGRLYSFKGLQSFKAQFHPEWSPRYLMHPGVTALPAVAVSIVSAISGEEFAWEFMRGAVPREKIFKIFGRRIEDESGTVRRGPMRRRARGPRPSASDPPRNPEAEPETREESSR